MCVCVCACRVTLVQQETPAHLDPLVPLGNEENVETLVMTEWLEVLYVHVHVHVCRCLCMCICSYLSCFVLSCSFVRRVQLERQGNLVNKETLD